MIKRFLAALAVLVLGATLALAAPMKGKVTPSTARRSRSSWSARRPRGSRRAPPVKFQGGVGRVAEIKDAVLTINSKNAAKLKVGDAIELDKGPADLAGC